MKFSITVRVGVSLSVLPMTFILIGVATAADGPPGVKTSVVPQIDAKADGIARVIGGYFGQLRMAQVDIESTMTVQAKEM